MPAHCMAKMSRFLQLAILLAVMAAGCSGSPLLGGYFANWAQYHTAPYTYTPDKLAPAVGSLDHLMYAFAYIDPVSFEVVAVEPKDPQFYAEVVAFKQQNPKLSVLLSVGGWNMPSATFSKMAADATHRTAFVASCVSTMKAHGFDGIDIDWESPCSPLRHDYVKFSCSNVKDSVDAGGSCPADRTNFLELVKEMRAAFGSTYMITVASQAAQSRWQHFDLIGMDQYVDVWHVMTYDYTVSDLPDSNTTAPNSPLYTPTGQGISSWSVNYTVQGYLSLGVPASKISIGIALYGHTWYVPGLTGNAWQKFGLPATIQGICCGPFKSTYGARYGKGSQLCGTMMYSEIQAAGGQTYYDNQTQSDIVYLATDSSDAWTKAGTWITYTAKDSAKAIAQYAVDNKLAGAFLFDMSMDGMDFTTETFTYDVTHVVRDTLNGGSGPPPPPPGHNSTCTPPSQCNVCTACCKTYLHAQSDCDACVSQQCPRTNVCLPAKGCNVCTACCKAYLTVQSDCDACVKQTC